MTGAHNLKPEYIIQFFGLKPLHEERGFYVETYRTEEKVADEFPPSRYTGP
jgi:predicted cupin superfamily sugar epimerase